ncbi:hypothetical protein [Streptomyces griseoluteus]|uniref:hypothetical protein n=1 Tax=Streptomyces griseoluteus TaxID=29306 RepID=UPI00380733E8
MAKRATDRDWPAAKPRPAKASRTVTAVYRPWSAQPNLVTVRGADLDAAAMWRALETETGPREEAGPAASLLDDDRVLPAFPPSSLDRSAGPATVAAACPGVSGTCEASQPGYAVCTDTPTRPEDPLP